MAVVELERALARHLPSEILKDIFPRGMRRLAEHGLFRKSAVVSTRFGFRMVADRLDAVKWFIYYFGQFEPQISLAWSRLLMSGDHVVDIGGNVGYHALLAGTLVGSTGRVVTVEPSKYIHAQLLNNIALNGYTHITAMKNAVSNQVGEVNLYFAGENIQGNSSMYQNDNHSQSEKVACITIEHIGEKIDLSLVKLIKIDVEGAEPLVLESLFQSLEALNPDVVIFVEISPNNTDETDNMLNPFISAGFEARLIPNEYDTAFYRNTNDVKLRPLRITPGVIHDVIMTRNPAKFDVIEGKV
jgi:FkbM family methyltransferase